MFEGREKREQKKLVGQLRAQLDAELLHESRNPDEKKRAASVTREEIDAARRELDAKILAERQAQVAPRIAWDTKGTGILARVGKKINVDTREHYVKTHQEALAAHKRKQSEKTEQQAEKAKKPPKLSLRQKQAENARLDEERRQKLKEAVRPIDEKWDAELKAAVEARERALAEEERKRKEVEDAPTRIIVREPVSDEDIQAARDAAHAAVASERRGKIKQASHDALSRFDTRARADRELAERLRVAITAADESEAEFRKKVPTEEQRAELRRYLDELKARHAALIDRIERVVVNPSLADEEEQPRTIDTGEVVADAAVRSEPPDKEGYYFPQGPTIEGEKELDPEIARALGTALEESTRETLTELERAGLKPGVLERVKRWYTHVRDTYDQLPAYQKLAVFGAYIGGSVAFTGGVGTALVATKGVLPAILWHVTAPIGLGATAGFAHYRSLRRRGYDSESAGRSASRVYIAATAAIAIGSIKLTSVLSSYFAPPPPEPSGVWEKYIKKYIPGL